MIQFKVLKPYIFFRENLIGFLLKCEKYFVDGRLAVNVVVVDHSLVPFSLACAEELKILLN